MAIGLDDQPSGNHPLLLSNSDHHPFAGNPILLRTLSESNKLWRIAGPSIFNRLAMFSLTVITQSFAGHLNDTDLAAISIVTMVIIGFTFALLLGMASALETLCGQAYGAKQYEILGIYLQRSWVVLFLSSILLLPLFLFATPILKLTGQPEAVAELAGTVAIWLIPMHLSFSFQFTLVRFLQCQLKTAIIAWVSALTLALHVFVNMLFVYKYKGGVIVAALTLDFSWWVSVLGLFGYVFFGGCVDSWNGFSTQAFMELWEFFKLSVASGVMLLAENIYYRVLVIVAGSMRKAEVEINALSICITAFGWETMIPLGFLAATGVRVANELGAGNAEGAKFATNVSLITSLVFGLFFSGMIMAFPDKMAMIFTSNSSTISMVKDELAAFLAITLLLNSIQPVLSGVAVGSGWQSQAALVNIGSYYMVGLPLGVILAWWLGFGIKGLWAGMLSGTVIQTLILAIITIKCEWNRLAKEAYSRVVDQTAF